MKTHDLAEALKLFAMMLKRSPNIDVKDLVFIDRFSTEMLVAGGMPGDLDTILIHDRKSVAITDAKPRVALLGADEQLGDMLAGEGLSRDPRDSPDRLLLVVCDARGVTAGRSRKALSDYALYRQLKGLLPRSVPSSRSRAGARTRACWVARRRTGCATPMGSHSIAAGVPLDVLQRGLGHASPSTTTIYTQPELARRIKESMRLPLGGNRAGSMA